MHKFGRKDGTSLPAICIKYSALAVSQSSAIMLTSISGGFLDPRQRSVLKLIMKFFMYGLLGATLGASVSFAVVVVTINFSAVVYLTKVFGKPSLL